MSPDRPAPRPKEEKGLGALGILSLGEVNPPRALLEPASD